MYTLFKTVHIIGVVVPFGNVTITAYWKVLADRTSKAWLSPRAARRDSCGLDLYVSQYRVGLGRAYGAAAVGGVPITGPAWLVIGQLLFAVSSLVWLGILVPIQIRQAHRTFPDT